MSNKTVECCLCRWTGLESKLDKIPTNRYEGVKAWDNVCPKCGCDEFYEVSTTQADKEKDSE